jgi:hypothetical protein
MSQPRDHSDPFAPPRTPCEVQCVHCGESFESWRIEWRELHDDPNLKGAWCCPTAGCDGIGFGFDIFPVDPDWTDERGERLLAADTEEAVAEDLGFGDDDDDLDPAIIGFDDNDEEEEDDDGLPIDAFDADSFWLDADALAPRPLGNTPQPPFDAMTPSKKPWSTLGPDDLPF